MMVKGSIWDDHRFTRAREPVNRSFGDKNVRQMKEAKIFERLANKFPLVDERHISALAEVWSLELDQIIKRMLDICRDEIGPVMPIDARPEAIFELAKLTLWLEDQIIEKKTENASIERVDPDQERLALETPTIQERIENTARICADRIWKRFLDKWSQRFPLVLGVQERCRPQKGGRVLLQPELSGVKNQHYSPSFSNEYWAVGPGKRIRVYARGVDQRVRSRDQGYTKWGRETFLYSQPLERLLCLIEGDAKVPYTKLLNLIPLSEQERRCWIAFLIAQRLRTPSFILKLLPRLKGFIESRQILFPTTTGSLRQAYETLFTNNDVFAEFYRLITTSQWELWSSPANGQFVRSDDPILICGSAGHGSWQLIYSMTPGRCFVAGPDKVANTVAVVPKNCQLDDFQLQKVNERLARSARRSVIARPVQNDSTLRMLLEDTLGGSLATSGWRERLFPEFWGPIE